MKVQLHNARDRGVRSPAGGGDEGGGGGEVGVPGDEVLGLHPELDRQPRQRLAWK